MKVHEYNEMMAYMLRPRQKFAIGGGVVEGEDLGTREGFGKPFKDSDMTATHKKFIKEFEEKTGEKYENQTKGKKWRIREGKLKYKQQAVTDPERIKQIKKFIKNFKKENNGELPTKNEIRQHMVATTGKDVQKVLKYLIEKKGLKLPSGVGMASLNVVDDDIKTLLSNRRILNALDKNQFPTDELIESVLDVDRTIAETRSVDLANFLKGTRKIRAYKAPKKYKKLATNFLNQQQDSGSSFIDRKTKRSRAYYEKEFSEMMDLPKNLDKIREDILRKITNIIPETKGLLAVDEIAGITSSMRRGSGPYAIFGQVLGGDFNTQTKGLGIDKAKGMLEKKLTTSLLKGNPERVVEQKKYNEKIKNFEVDANKNNPAKKVRGLKLSFEPPSKTIKNKKVYNQYKDLFDAHYEKHGYSFEVPADRDSIVDISNKLDTKSFQNTVKNRFKNLIKKGGRAGAVAGLISIAGTGFALADDEGQIPQGLPAQTKEQNPSFIEEYPYLVGTTAAASPLLTKTGRKIYGGVLKGGFRAFGSVPSGLGFSASQFVDINPFSDEFGELQEDPNIGLAGVDLLFPEIGKRLPLKGTSLMSRLGSYALNPFQLAEKASRFGKVGRGIASLARVPSLMTPVGLTLMGAEGIMMGMREQERINQMRETDPEAYQEYLADQEDMLRESAAYGGRMGFDEGGPSDPSRRKFMKIMGGLASLPIVGKFFRVAEQTPVVQNIFTEIQKLKNSETLMPDWFPTFLDKFRREGVAENIFKKKKVEVSKAEYDKAFAEGKGQDYYTDVARTQEYKANNPDHMDYYKYEDTDELIGTTYTNEKVPGVKVDDFDGEVSVNWENDYSQPVSIEYVKPGMEGADLGRLDKYEAGFADKQLKPEGEFAAVDQEVYATDPDGGFEATPTVVKSLDDMMEGTTRVMEEYATGKPVRTLSKGEGKVIEAEIRAEQAAESAAEMADDFGDFE